MEENGVDLQGLKEASEHKEVLGQIIDAYDEEFKQSKSGTGMTGSVISSNSINLKITDVSQFKSYSIRMLKALKEDLAKIQNEFV